MNNRESSQLFQVFAATERTMTAPVTVKTKAMRSSGFAPAISFQLGIIIHNQDRRSYFAQLFRSRFPEYPAHIFALSSDSEIRTRYAAVLSDVFS